MPFLIDTHAHLYAEEFEEDRGDMLQRAKDAGIEAILLPNIDSSSIVPMEKLASQHPSCIQMMAQGIWHKEHKEGIWLPYQDRLNWNLM